MQTRKNRIKNFLKLRHIKNKQRQRFFEKVKKWIDLILILFNIHVNFIIISNIFAPI